MKRVLLVVLFILMMFLYACGSTSNTPIPPVIGTAVAQTQTATMWTASVTPTINPDVSKIMSLLNGVFQEDTLEMTLDARYFADNVLFQNKLDNSSGIFYLYIRCVCAINSHCCTPERIFVVTMHAMKKRHGDIIAQVPDHTLWVDVTCYNNTGSIGVMRASWSDVKAFLLDEIDGSILGWHVTPNPPP
jgi:hypothetical protein